MSFNVLRGRHIILPPSGHCRAMQQMLHWLRLSCFSGFLYKLPHRAMVLFLAL